MTKEDFWAALCPEDFFQWPYRGYRRMHNSVRSRTNGLCPILVLARERGGYFESNVSVRSAAEFLGLSVQDTDKIAQDADVGLWNGRPLFEVLSDRGEK